VQVLCMSVHKSSRCAAAIAVCRNTGCDVSMARRDLIVHQKTVCPFEWICCPYEEEFGCNHSARRENMPTHTDNASIHLPMIASKLAKLPVLEAKVATLNKALTEENRTTTMLKSHLKASLGPAQARNVRIDRGQQDDRCSTSRGAYSGQMRADQRHGFGHFVCDSGDKYEGRHGV
jgi:hypothetical protein